jgi:predicted metal-dependent hydrolase
MTSVLGTPVACRLRRSRRARRLRLMVDRAAVLTLVVPSRFPLGELPAAVLENARWILRTIRRFRDRGSVERLPLADGREIMFLGERRVIRLLLDDALSTAARVQSMGHEIRASVPPLHPRSGAQMVRAWLRAAARREIPGRVRALNDPLGFPLGRISVRDQRTKWGACSARGNVSINWRLALAPPEILDYVIFHELCHLRELNHSREFWTLLRSLRPNCERERSWLKENGHALDV